MSSDNDPASRIRRAIADIRSRDPELADNIAEILSAQATAFRALQERLGAIEGRAQLGDGSG